MYSIIAEDFKAVFAQGLRENPAKAPINDLQVGRFIADYVRTDDHYVTYRTVGKSSGEWYVWDGIVHRLTQTEMDEVLVGAFIDAYALLAHELKSTGNPDKAEDARKRVHLWSSNTSMNGLKARVKAALRVPMDHFDKDASLVVMADGRVLDLSQLDAEPMAPSPHRPVTRHLGVQADLENTQRPGRWLSWLEEFIPNKEERDFLQQTAGAALVGNGRAKNIVHFVGAKDTGKSFYVNVLTYIFGDYAGDLASTAIVAKYGGATNYAQSSAKGVRFLTLSEPSTQKTDDAFLKSISGSRDPIRTERKGQNEEQWYAQCVLHIAANSVVQFNTSDPAIVDRINVIQMDRVLAPHEIDDELEDRIIDEEGDGILAWIIAGADHYMEHGITVPESVKARAQANVVDSSSPLRWQAERVEEGKYVLDNQAPASQFLERSEAFKDYQQWCGENSEHPVKSLQFRNEINTHNGLRKGASEPKSNGTMRLYGVRHLGQDSALRLPYQGKSATLSDLGFEG